MLPVTRETCEDVRYKVEATRIGLADPTVFADDPNGTTEAKLEKIGLDQNAFISGYVMDSGDAWNRALEDLKGSARNSSPNLPHSDGNRQKHMRLWLLDWS